ncbi:MAG: single-stranded-DNA-specific exonuclease RecJ [Pirellula sp.]|nr:single-stranded-DNA-specific exonuclease RecJ [Pirellula sp.]
MPKRWVFRGHDSARFLLLAEQAGIDPIISQLLCGRGIAEPAAAKFFLEAKFSDLRDPCMLPGMEEACERILRAVRDREPIAIYGDYDADGMTATAILLSCLEMLGADVAYFVPNRLEDSYGLSTEALERLSQRGRKLIISVDCGISAVAEAEACRQLGMDLIITDHHPCGESLPEANAIVHPMLPGGNYPFPGLCGAGVAFKIAWRLCQLTSGAKRVTDEHRAYLLSAMGLAALGTIADVVPLLDENRILVRNALQILPKQAPLGLQCLLKLTGLASKSSLSAEDIAFSLAPRLNAAGRLGQAQLGVELLTTKDPQRAEMLAQYLDRLNADRESLERSITLAASKQAREQYDLECEPALVLHAPGWHLGVIGIVASRMADKFQRPVVIISCDPTGQKHATGSGRSAGIVDLHEAFHACREHLIGCGGHASAAGLRIEERRIAEFREAFCEFVRDRIGDSDPVTQLHVDAEATFQQLSLNTVERIEQLAPFGAANPRPVLVASDVELHEPAKRFGNGERHVSARFRQHGTILRAVAFSQAEWMEPINSHQGNFDLAFRPTINEFQGFKKVELQLLDWRAAKQSPNAPTTTTTKRTFST